jgi:3-oxo-5-alpha-steroid 4-dehydrogenase 3 / polyprenol reductase
MFELMWTAFIVSTILVGALPSYFGFIAQHGKTTPPPTTAATATATPQDQYMGQLQLRSPSIRAVISCLATCSVSKSWFISFYVVGVTMTLLCMYYAANLVLLLFLIQTIRRLLESLLTPYGSSRMHVSGLIVGLMHYLAVPIALLRAPSADLIPLSSLQLTICLSLFCLASLAQTVTHYQLRVLKVNQLKDGLYSLPTGLLFSLVCCPHYAAEVLIYLSLYLTQRSQELLLIFLWVAVNHVVVAQHNYAWYADNFPSRIDSKWKRLVPFVW